MSTDRASLQRWADHFREIDGCPWPGPAPLTESQGHLLVGRTDDRRRFDALLKEENKRLLLLHAPSGAGKSSLLEAGLKRELKAQGATIYTVNKWGGYGGESAREFLAKKLQPEASSFEYLDDLGASGVLILDQFEELVRYSPAVTRQLFDEILWINRHYKTKVVVSFRSEYLHEFAGLERGAVNFSVGSMSISEIEDRFALAVVKSGNRREDMDKPAAIEEEAATWLAAQWTNARTRLADREGVLVSDDPFDRVGLLHLQALLYSLYFSSREKPLTLAGVQQALAHWNANSPAAFGPGAGDGAIIAPEGFRAALGRSVELKLSHCDKAGRRDNVVDSQLRRGTRRMVERTVEHLSSAGYKLIRSARELALLALGTDHQQLRRGLKDQSITEDHERDLLDVLLQMALLGESADENHGDAPTGRGGGANLSLDLIEAARREVAELVDVGAKGPAWTNRLAKPGSEPFDNDPHEVTSGYFFGLTPADALIEEFRRFAFALRWMEESALIRVATPLAGHPMVSLIHDGFGTALNHWADAARQDPEGVLSAPTSPRGFTFEWPDRREGLLSRRPGDEGDRSRDDAVWSATHRVLTNLRWQYGSVERTRLERIAFLNCDFQGLQFKECTLEGVVFVNCLLDGALFSDCTFSGQLPGLAVDDEWSPEDPSFVVDSSTDLAPLFRRYLWDGVDVVPGSSTSVFCDLPGAPAIPYDGRDTAPNGSDRTYLVQSDQGERNGRLRVDLVGGGAAIYGGRVSNLVMRRCEFAKASGVAIRHATGSGLDLVEVRQKSGDFGPSHVEIFGSAVRHLTVSTSPGELGSVDLSAVGSMLAQTYVGTGLSGSVKAHASSLLHVWNASPHSDEVPGVKFLASDCSVHGALDITLDEQSQEIGTGPQVGSAADVPLPGRPLPERLARMDYRRNPAKFRAESPGNGKRA